MPTCFIVLIHEGITQPQILEIGLGMLEALGQGIDVVVLVVRDGTLVLGHDRGFVVLHVRGVLLRKIFLESRNTGFAFRNGSFVLGGLKVCGNILTARKQSYAKQGRHSQGLVYVALSHWLPSLCL